MRPIKFIVFMFFAELLVGCASQPMSISAERTQCCLPEAISTYSLVNVDVPPFLKQMVEASLSVAVQSLGLQATDAEQADILVYATYEQIDVDIRLSDKPPLLESMNASGSQKFVARINVRITDSDQQKVWQGYVERLHSVEPGEYMHRGKAVNPITAALVQLFSLDN